MSFGFLIGDFLAFGKLIAEVTTSLQSVGGAKSDYQELILLLKSLQTALEHLHRLDQRRHPAASLDSIKQAAQTCQHLLKEFQPRIKTYEQSLGVWGKTSRMKSTLAKLRWTFGVKGEVQKLQGTLSMQVGTINMLLAEHGFAKLDIATDAAASQHLDLRERLVDSHVVLQSLETRSSTQALALRDAGALLHNIHQMVSGNNSKSGVSSKEADPLYNYIAEIHGVLSELAQRQSTVDTRWTFFQAPFVVEDTLGFRFPVPSEYEIDLLHHIIQFRFKTGPGSHQVNAGSYKLVRMKDGKSIASNERLSPGTEIVMAIVIGLPASNIIENSHCICILQECGSVQTYTYPGGGRICSSCNVWYDPVTGEKDFIPPAALKNVIPWDDGSDRDGVYEGDSYFEWIR